jgi:hypothetical protein
MDAIKQAIEDLMDLVHTQCAANHLAGREGLPFERVGMHAIRHAAESLSVIRAQQDTKDEHIVWCGCGDEIVQGSGAKCGTCAAIDTMCPGVSGEGTKDGERINLSDYINGADILASDMPAAVVEKLQAAIDAARGADRG